MTEEASVLGYPEHPGKAACQTGEKGKCMNQSDVKASKEWIGMV